jgi:hypothetical protein
MFNPTFETAFRRCLIPKERPRKNIFGHRLDEIQKLEDTKFSKKRDAKFKRDGIKPKTPIDSTEDTVRRKTRTRRFRRKKKAENRKSNVVVLH